MFLMPHSHLRSGGRHNLAVCLEVDDLVLDDGLESLDQGMHCAHGIEGGQLLGGWLAPKVGVLFTVEVIPEHLELPLDLVLVNISIGLEGLLQCVER